MTIMQVGMNLSVFQSGFASTQFPFLNLFKLSSGWGGDGNVDHVRYFEDSMNLDANGYPINLLCKTGSPAALAGNSWFQGQFDGQPVVQAYTLQSTGYAPAGVSFAYPAGTYVLLWTGSGDPVLTQDGATLTSSNTNRKLYSISSPSSGVRVELSVANASTNPNVTNLALIYSPDAVGGNGGSTTPGVNGTGTHEALYNAGQLFNQNATLIGGSTGGIPFIDRINKFACQRFMDWNLTNSNQQVTWSQRTIPSYFHWTTCPFEVMTALCNKTNSDGWFCVPLLADSTFNANMASIVANGDGGSFSGLNTNLKAYVENGNEIWNAGGLGQPRDAMATNGYAALPDMQFYLAKFTASISGTTMTVTAMLSGGFGVIKTISQDDGNRIFGAGISGIYRVISQTSGTPGGVGIYELDFSPGTIGSETISQGSDANAAVYNGVRLGVLYGAAWRSTFANPARVVRVLASGGGYGTQVLTQTASQFGGNPANWTGKSGDQANCEAFSFNTYFGNSNPPGSDTIAQFFTQATADVAQGVINATAAFDVSSAGLDHTPLLISYEGGQSYYPDGDGSKQSLYAQANRNTSNNPNFYHLYLSYLPQLRDTIGITLFNHFADVGNYSDVTNTNNGNFPVLENIQQTTSSKYQALLDFIASESLSASSGRKNYITFNA